MHPTWLTVLSIYFTIFNCTLTVPTCLTVCCNIYKIFNITTVYSSCTITKLTDVICHSCYELHVFSFQNIFDVNLPHAQSVQVFSFVYHNLFMDVFSFGILLPLKLSTSSSFYVPSQQHTTSLRHTHKINKSRAIRKYFFSNLAYFHGQFKQAFSAATMLSLINTYIWFGKRMKKR